MRALVTGSEGFIGTNLLKRLPPDTMRVDRKRGDELVELRRSDFAWVDIVYHLAANSDIARGATDPLPDYRDTIQGTFSLIHAMDGRVRRVVYLSGSGVYGDTGGEPVDEDSRIAPVSMYGAAKASAEAMLSYYAHTHGAQVLILRPCNILGPHATHGVVYDFVRKLQRDPRRLDVLGNGSQQKPYLHVEDLLDLIEDDVYFWLVRVAKANVPGELMTVAEIARHVCRRMGVDPVIHFGETPGGWPGDVPRVDLQSKVLRGWKPKRSAVDAIHDTVDWLVAHPEAP